MKLLSRLALLASGMLLTAAATSCTQLYTFNLREVMVENHFSYLGLDLLHPYEGCVLMGENEHYMLCKLKEFKSHTPLVTKALDNDYPQLRESGSADSERWILVRLIPGKEKAAHTLQILVPPSDRPSQLNYQLARGSRPDCVTLTVSGEVEWNCENLRPVAMAPETLRNEGLPAFTREANCNPSLYLLCSPLYIVGTCADSALSLLSYTAEGIIKLPVFLAYTSVGTQQQQVSEADRKLRSRRPEASIQYVPLKEFFSNASAKN